MQLVSFAHIQPESALKGPVTVSPELHLTMCDMCNVIYLFIILFYELSPYLKQHQKNVRRRAFSFVILQQPPASSSSCHSICLPVQKPLILALVGSKLHLFPNIMDLKKIQYVPEYNWHVYIKHFLSDWYLIMIICVHVNIRFPFHFSSVFCPLLPSQWRRSHQLPVNSIDIDAFAFGATGNCLFCRNWRLKANCFFTKKIHTHVWLQLMASLEHSVLDKGQSRSRAATLQRAQ